MKQLSDSLALLSFNRYLLPSPRLHGLLEAKLMAHKSMKCQPQPLNNYLPWLGISRKVLALPSLKDVFPLLFGHTVTSERGWAVHHPLVHNMWDFATVMEKALLGLRA